MPGADLKWRYYQSTHFEMYSRNGDSESRRLLHNLEQVHAIFFETFSLKATRAVPVTVYFFSRDKYFDAYKPEARKKLENIGALYHAELDRGIMTVAPLPTYEAAQQLAFASYTYHLFRLTGEQPPMWYSYGVSGIFRNLVIDYSEIELGRPDPQQVARLRQARLIPVEAMLGSDESAGAFGSEDSFTLFHDESWAMVHYLYFGQHKIPRAGINAFVDYALARGRDFDAAAMRQVFQEKTGLDYAQMNTALRGYFDHGSYGYSKLKLPEVPAEKTYAMRPVPWEEINLRLAELALRVNRDPAGKLAMLQAKDRPADAVRALEVLGSDAVKDGDRDGAADRWEQAVASGSVNEAVLDELCQNEMRNRFGHFDIYFRLPDDEARDLRQLAQKSIAVAPHQASAYELLGWTEAFAREPQIRNVNLVQANFNQTKDRMRTLLALAVVRMRLGDKPGAADILNQMEGAKPNDWAAYGIEIVRAQLEDRAVDRTKLPAPRNAGSGLRMQFGKPPRN